jgi:hypothetical protein
MTHIGGASRRYAADRTVAVETARYQREQVIQSRDPHSQIIVVPHKQETIMGKHNELL